MSRRRSLSDDEQALWRDFVRSIAPLQTSRKTPRPAAQSSVSPPAAKPSGQVLAPKAKPTAAPPAAPQPRRAPPLAQLGRRSKQRIARGREAIDARLDLHGMTQSQAHAALLRFLHRARAEGARTVLVVTGKGSGKASDVGPRYASAERGVLRRQVPLWLALPEFRPLIVAFDDAHVGHGGQGALYVRLRREK